LCVLALLRSNTTFYLTSIKLFYIRDIKVSSKSPKDNLKYYNEGDNEGEGNSNIGIIPLIISIKILLKHNRG
jgi:hypothetical protein